MGELWRPVIGFEGLYEVSTRGRVRSMSKTLPFLSKRGRWCTRVTQEKFLAPQEINSGYLVVHLSHKGRRTARTVHSLMAAAFIGPRPAKCDVAHADGDRVANRIENLRYATRAENLADELLHGTRRRGSQVNTARLDEAQIPAIRALAGAVTAAEAARRFRVAEMTIWRVWRRETWAHV